MCNLGSRADYIKYAGKGSIRAAIKKPTTKGGIAGLDFISKEMSLYLTPLITKREVNNMAYVARTKKCKLCSTRKPLAKFSKGGLNCNICINLKNKISHDKVRQETQDKRDAAAAGYAAFFLILATAGRGIT